MKNSNLKTLVNAIKKSGPNILIIGPLDLPKNRLRAEVKKLNPSLILLIDGGVQHTSLIPRDYLNKIFKIGDGDSHNRNLDILLDQRKDYSDLDFAIDGIIKSKMTKKISALGFTHSYVHSKREERFDHFIMNLGSFSRLSQKLKLPILLDDAFEFIPAGKHTLNHHGIFSIITLRNQKVKLIGKVEYPLNNWTKMRGLSSLGLSNVAHGKFQIENKLGVILFKAN
jgi:thiamine pyrophosphokinase